MADTHSTQVSPEYGDELTPAECAVLIDKLAKHLGLIIIATVHQDGTRVSVTLGRKEDL